MFATLGNRPHSQRKRLLSHIYAKSYLHSSVALNRIARAVIYERVLPRLRTGAPAQVLDVCAFFNAVTMDFISNYIFGLRCGTNHVLDASENERWLHMYHKREGGRFWLAELPRLAALLSWLGVRITSKETERLGRQIGAFGLDLCARAERALGDGKSDKGTWEEGDEPLVYGRLAKALSEGDASAGKLRPGVPVHLEVVSEMIDHFCALNFSSLPSPSLSPIP